MNIENIDNQTLARYIVNFLIKKIDEAEEEDVEIFLPIVFEALETLKGTYGEDEYNQALVEMGYTLKEKV